MGDGVEHPCLEVKLEAGKTNLGLGFELLYNITSCGAECLWSEKMGVEHLRPCIWSGGMAG